MLTLKNWQGAHWDPLLTPSVDYSSRVNRIITPVNLHLYFDCTVQWAYRFWWGQELPGYLVMEGALHPHLEDDSPTNLTATYPAVLAGSWVFLMRTEANVTAGSYCNTAAETRNGRSALMRPRPMILREIPKKKEMSTHPSVLSQLQDDITHIASCLGQSEKGKQRRMRESGRCPPLNVIHSRWFCAFAGTRQPRPATHHEGPTVTLFMSFSPIGLRL